MMRHKTRAIGALLVLTLVWGYSWVLIKLAVAQVHPLHLAAHRSFIAALALFVVLKLLGRPLRPQLPKAFFVLGLVQTTIFLSLQGSALVAGGAGKTAVLAYTMPIWTLWLSSIFLGERLRPIQGVAGLFALAGLLLIISPWSLSSSPLSQILALGAAWAWSVGTIMSKRLGRTVVLDVLNLNAWQCLFGSLMLMLIVAFLPIPAVHWNGHYLGLVLAIGVLVTALGWALWSYVLSHLPAWQASLAVLGVPAVALLTSRWQMGEQVDVWESLGIGLIVLGLALLSYLGWRSEARSRAQA